MSAELLRRLYRQRLELDQLGYLRGRGIHGGVARETWAPTTPATVSKAIGWLQSTAADRDAGPPARKIEILTMASAQRWDRRDMT